MGFHRTAHDIEDGEYSQMMTNRKQEISRLRELLQPERCIDWVGIYVSMVMKRQRRTHLDQVRQWLRWGYIYGTSFVWVGLQMQSQLPIQRQR